MESKEEKMFELVKGWNKKKENRQAYCERHGISERSFRHWIRQYYIRQYKELEPDVFETIRPEEEEKEKEIPISTPSIELQYPNGVVLRLPSGTPLSMVGDFLKLV